MQPWLLPTEQPRWQNQGMKAPKAMTIRLSVEQAEALETVATVDDMAVVEVIRAAIDEHVESRKQDAEFQRGLRERIERAQSLLKP
jgi:predicted transcriptional regulator